MNEKNLTIKFAQLAEQGKKLTAKVDGQQKQISRLTENDGYGKESQGVAVAMPLFFSGK